MDYLDYFQLVHGSVYLFLMEIDIACYCMSINIALILWNKLTFDVG